MYEAQVWYSYLKYKILENECKEWGIIFLHENRLLKNLLNTSGQKNEQLYVNLVNYKLAVSSW